MLLWHAVRTMQQPYDQSASRTVIIVVDDDDAVRNALTFSLEAEGFSVRAFADGEELLKQGVTAACGCLVIDHNMRGMSGMDLIDTLRDQRVETPALLITSQPGHALKARAAQAGVSIVEKPLLGSVLMDAISRIMTPRPSPSSG